MKVTWPVGGTQTDTPPVTVQYGPPVTVAVRKTGCAVLAGLGLTLSVVVVLSAAHALPAPLNTSNNEI